MPEPEPERSADQRADARVAAKRPRVARFALVVEIALVAVFVLGGTTLRLRIAHPQWVFAGSDSYGYLKIADEWRRDHRFAFGPPPQPLQWYRRPLYPLFLVVARGDARAEMDGGPGWRRIELAQLALELLLMWPLLYVACRRVGGRLAALVALALATLYPPAVVFPLAALTESLAMTLTVAAVAPLLLYRGRSRAPYYLAAAGFGLAALLRPDGIVLGVAFLPAIFLDAASGWRVRLRTLAIAGGLFLAIFGWWPLRNLVRFERPHLADGMIDRLGGDVPNYAGFWDWMRTWSQDERGAAFPASCFYDNLCDESVELFEPLQAFEAPATNAIDERATVARLLKERRRLGVTPAISAAFDELARARRRAHPFRVWIELPLRRAARAWWAPQTELVQNSRAWPQFFQKMIPSFKRYGRVLYVATFIAMIALLLFAGSRIESLVLTVPLLARSLALGWTGFALPRYVAPSYPLCFMLIGLAATCLAQRGRQLAERARRARSGDGRGIGLTPERSSATFHQHS